MPKRLIGFFVSKNRGTSAINHELNPQFKPVTMLTIGEKKSFFK